MQLHTVFCKGNQEPAFTDAAMIRETVFIQEQGFTAEFDDIDSCAWHIVVYDGSIPVATGRFFADENMQYHIGRVAVQKNCRKLGIGAYLMHELEHFAAKQGVSEITLDAQTHAVRFYEKLGYMPYGKPFYDEYCEHIAMHKQI